MMNGFSTTAKRMDYWRLKMFKKVINQHIPFMASLSSYISALQNEENVNVNYPISILVHETACQRLEGQKTSAIKCNSGKEKGGGL